MENKGNKIKIILKYPVATEKAVKIIETENKLTFVVDKRATKKDIAEAFEKEFKIKPLNVNTQIRHNKKIAYIKLKTETPALDIATKLGLM